ncbi:MAG: SPOR domain-containing protein, partial [Burkholderiales bacterium]|nr:SPOR domain-containing protein [Burkholderiales bacterium]
PRPAPLPAVLPRPEPKASPRSEPPPEPKAAVQPERKPPAAPANDGARASALLAGAAPPSASPAPPPGPAASAAAAVRFVVQVGAYADGATLHHARAQVAKLGLSTYTQVVNSPGGKRTRVRVGPFDHRAEADAAAARIRRSGLPASVLAL